MPTYETWKYCNFIELDKECGKVAYAECTAPGCLHKDHPRFVCTKHQSIVELVDEALERMSYDYH